MLRLLFICRCVPSLSKEQRRALQKDIWRRCSDKGIYGFVVRSGTSLIGAFEKDEKTVISQVERLIRAQKVQSVQVLDETSVVEPTWRAWHSEFETLEDVLQADVGRVAGLAQIMMDAVEADARRV